MSCKQPNLDKCTCTYTSCSKHGKCCECIEYHRSKGEMVGCYFTPEAEKTYDRSIANFIRSTRI